MGNMIYETFVIKVYEDNTPVGYVSSSAYEHLWVVNDKADGMLYDSYKQAEQAMNIIAKRNPEYKFDVEVVFLDTDDMQALCN